VIVPLLLATLAVACPATPVRASAYAGEPVSLHRTAWVASANGTFAGHLFYWSETPWQRTRRTAAIWTTRYRHRVSPKILWIARTPTSAPTVTISGRRLDGPGRFRTVARYAQGGRDGAGAGAQFPSEVAIPSAGCWRVTVTAGRVSGDVVFAAFDG
jgi:hypothetical protein